MDGDRAVAQFDASVPNPARMYDYYLGGKDNFQADRDAADEVLAVVPEARALSVENRAAPGPEPAGSRAAAVHPALHP